MFVTLNNDFYCIIFEYALHKKDINKFAFDVITDKANLTKSRT